MKHFLLASIEFYQSNGLLGISLSKINQLRAGADAFARIPHTELSSQTSSNAPKGHMTAEQIDELLNDDRISQAQKVRGLNAWRGNREDQCPAPEFDMKKEYGNFIQKISEKGCELECSQERFNELSTNPQTGSFNEKSLIEAKGGLQGEAQGMYINIRRPINKVVDLDFEIDSSKGYTHVDHKTPIDFQDLADKRGIDVSNFLSLETVAYNMGKKITPQKEKFCGLPNGPKSPENLLHVVNLDLIRDSNQKQNMIDSVLKGAEDKSDNTVGIYFLNYL